MDLLKGSRIQKEKPARKPEGNEALDSSIYY